MDIISYLMGAKSGEGTIVLDSSTLTFTDENSDGEIVITEE